jgi:hypothetical protein
MPKVGGDVTSLPHANCLKIGFGANVCQTTWPALVENYTYYWNFVQYSVESIHKLACTQNWPVYKRTLVVQL